MQWTPEQLAYHVAWARIRKFTYDEALRRGQLISSVNLDAGNIKLSACDHEVAITTGSKRQVVQLTHSCFTDAELFDLHGKGAIKEALFKLAE